MKMFRFFLLLALSCTALLFFGIKANPKLVGGFTMTIAFIINVGAIGYCLWTIPKVYFSPKEQKRSIWEVGRDRFVDRLRRESTPTREGFYHFAVFYKRLAVQRSKSF